MNTGGLKKLNYRASLACLCASIPTGILWTYVSKIDYWWYEEEGLYYTVYTILFNSLFGIVIILLSASVSYFLTAFFVSKESKYDLKLEDFMIIHSIIVITFTIFLFLMRNKYFFSE